MHWIQWYQPSSNFSHECAWSSESQNLISSNVNFLILIHQIKTTELRVDLTPRAAPWHEDLSLPSRIILTPGRAARHRNRYFKSRSEVRETPLLFEAERHAFVRVVCACQTWGWVAGTAACIKMWRRKQFSIWVFVDIKQFLLWVSKFSGSVHLTRKQSSYEDTKETAWDS